MRFEHKKLDATSWKLEKIPSGGYMPQQGIQTRQKNYRGGSRKEAGWFLQKCDW